jgi:hypothetical protein
MGAIVFLIGSLLVFASVPASPAHAPTLPPTSDKLTVIWCGAVLGESFDQTRMRLGPPASHSVQGATESWVFPVNQGASQCIFSVAQGRVIEIDARENSEQPDPSTKDPYGVSLGSSIRELVALRGNPLQEGSNDRQYLYPSASGACWLYHLGQGRHQKDAVVTGIDVFLNFNSREEDCQAP